MRVRQNVAFQVFQKRWIRYENREIWNMWKPEEVWEHSAHQDERILPLEVYETSDKRPWGPHGRIEFRLKVENVPDMTENGCGSAGGEGPDWNWPRVDPVPAGIEQGKVLVALGGRTWPLDGDSSGTDSEEDEEDSDDHKLAKIRHALGNLSQTVQVIINGRYE
jgi:hypothetical protein